MAEEKIVFEVEVGTPGAAEGDIEAAQDRSHLDPELSEGFGLDKFFEGFGGAVGDILEDYSSYDIVCNANSVDGKFTFSSGLDKYTRVEVDIINTSFENTALPHWVVEDTFEWVNSGTPSHLSQVYHSNIVNFGIDLETTNPGLQDSVAPAYQAEYVVPCNQDWYDRFNSTVDYSLDQDFGNRGLDLPHPNAAIFIESANKIWVGGQGGVLSINTEDDTVDRIPIDSRRSLFIKDIFPFENKVYVLDEKSLYEYDLSSDTVTRDNGLGLPEKMYKFVLMLNDNLVIGGEDGIYARKSTQDDWQRVAETSGPVTSMIAPDAAFAIANNEVWFSTDGFTWRMIGSISGRNINDMVKHRSQILLATDEGLYGDSGSFYTEGVSIALIDILEDADESRSVTVNNVVSNFDEALISLSDGRYVIWDMADFSVVDSDFDALHKIIHTNSARYLFSYNMFRKESASIVNRMSTGVSLTKGKGQIFTI